MKTLKYFLFTSWLIGSFSCGKNFNDINIDPNNPQEVPPEVLLTSSEKVLADNVSQMFAGPEILAQTWTENSYPTTCRYDIPAVRQNSWFIALYAGVLKDLENIKKITLENPGLDPLVDKNKIAIAIVLRAYTFQFLTDIFGPIPYSEALQGDKNRTPKYDSQRDIYLGLIDELKEAIIMMDTTYGSFGGADIIYRGNVTQWKKLAYSLLLRLSMRMSDVEPDLAQMEIENAYLYAFTSVADNANFTYLTAAPNTNPLYQQRIERGDADTGLSDILIDKTLKPLNDPRLPVWADETEVSGGYFGRPYGQNEYATVSEQPTQYSQPSGASVIRAGMSNFKPFDLLRPDAKACLMGYAEVCFILAEAIERGWITGSAHDWYDSGIRASMNEWGIMDENVIGNYLAQKDVYYSTAPGDYKQKIGVQKWLALFMQGIQGWSEWRRLDFEKLELPVDGALGDVGSKVAPVRIVYPSDEQSLNSTNYLSALGLLGDPDRLYTRLWWDVH